MSDMADDKIEDSVDWSQAPMEVGPVLMLLLLTAEVISLFTPANLHAVVFFSLIASVWSLKNVTIGPLKQDIGIVTNTLVFIAYCLTNKTFQVIAPNILAVHFALAMYSFFAVSPIKLARKIKKSVKFVYGMRIYIVGTFFYWIAVGVMRLEEEGDVGGFSF